MIEIPTRPCPDLLSKFLNKLIQKNNQYGVILEILQVPIFEREGVMKGGFEICEMIDPGCDDTLCHGIS